MRDARTAADLDALEEKAKVLCEDLERSGEADKAHKLWNDFQAWASRVRASLPAPNR